MAHETKVSQVMTGEVVVADLNNSIKQVQDLFVEYDMHHLPVVDDDKVIGIISQTDLLNCYDKLLEDGKTVSLENLNSTFTVESVMTPKPVSVAPVTTLRTAADMMDEHHCHSLPVVDHGKIAGILTARDVVKYVGQEED